MNTRIEPVSDYDKDMGGSTSTKKTDSELESELKKRNLKSVFGSGVGRISIIVIGFIFILLLGFSFYGLTKKRTVTQEDARNAANAVISAPTQGDPMVVSDQERAMRIEASNLAAAEAAKEGKVYMAPAVLKVNDTSASVSGATSTIAGSPVNGAPPANPAQDKQNQINAQLQAQQNSQSQPQNNADAQAAALSAAAVRQKWEQKRKEELEPQILVALGRSEDANNKIGYHESFYALPDRTPKSASIGASQSGAAISQTSGNQKAVPFIQAGDAYYCETLFKINTDSAKNDVVAVCESGKLAGARVIGKWEASKESVIDGSVSMTFNSMSLKGRPAVAISAIAIDDLTEEPGMADDVDNHTFRKYSGVALSSFLTGLGKAASIVTGTTNTVSTGGTTYTSVVTDPITPSRQAKIALGETGVAVGNAVQRDSALITRTIKLNKRKGIRILFLSDVIDEKK